MSKEKKNYEVSQEARRRKNRQLPKAERKKQRNSMKSRNKEFARITYVFVALFLGMMFYIVYFNVVRGKEIVNSPYNTRQDSFADRVVRGKIVDANGNVLAETQIAEDGSESRYYPYGPEFAHVVGYSTQGKSGLESIENFNLLTSNTFFVEKIKNEFQNVKNQGDTVVTTLDENLQSAAYQAMGENKGAVIVMEPSTGKILAMVSAPSYDPNSVADNWDYLNSGESGSALLNRVTQGSYAPGSTFKVVTALEYMRENVNYGSYQYDCTGQIEHDGTTIHCFDYTAHGLQDLRSSMANSCNSSFANIGLTLNRTSYAKTAKEVLFNTKLSCPLESSQSSFKVDENTDTAELMMTAMGQGQTLVSPYHMALITSAIANGGTLMTPYLVSQVTNYAGTEISRTKPSYYKTLMTSEEASQLKEYMEAVVSEGTATALSGESYTVAGKTGTAEYSSESDSNLDHSWFIGFTNVDHPELAIAVVVEGSDGDSTAKAVPIAKQVLDAYYY